MARSSLQSLVSGVRQILTLQLFVSIGAVALAGWTLSVTDTLISERERLRARVVQLEQALASNGIVTPPRPAVVAAPAEALGASAYPGALGAAEDTPAQQDIAALFGSLFAPPAPLQVVVLHARAEADRANAEAIAEALRAGGLEVYVRVMPSGDPRPASYIYYDGRQSAAAAALTARVHDLARAHGLAAWSAQLRGVALPARGEYAADRVDLVLPALPPPPSVAAAPP